MVAQYVINGLNTNKFSEIIDAEIRELELEPYEKTQRIRELQYELSTIKRENALLKTQLRQKQLTVWGRF